MTKDADVDKWHILDGDQVAVRLGSDAEDGLTGAEALRRLREHGPNALLDRGVKGPWRILWEQFTDTMVVILIAAALISVLLQDVKDAIAILIIVVLNALLGFRQEYKAEKAMAALKALAVPSVHAVRDGEMCEVSALHLVPGDIVILEAGSMPPADGRILQAINLRLQESALTGESEPVEKHSLPLPEGETEYPPADRRNMAYMGTAVAAGRGRMILTATGMNTELGRIATLIQTLGSEATPLQRRLSQLGRGLAVAALALVGVVFLLGLARGEELTEMFFIAISMAVAAVPEGLPAVVTIALALGSQRMLKRHALIRKLPAVETLGSVTVICSDKTGTLTQNRMTVAVLHAAGHSIHLQAPLPPSSSDTTSLSQDLTFLLMGGALCNDAGLGLPDAQHPDQTTPMGDPTESALVLAAARFGLHQSGLERALPRVAEVPFDSDRKRMTTVHCIHEKELLPSACSGLLEGMSSMSHTGSHLAFTKGAVEGLVGISATVLVNNLPEPLTEEWKQRLLAAHDELAQDGMRVLGVACRLHPSFTEQIHEKILEEGLLFLGMVGMIDPPRPEVRSAVATCRRAGIRPVMITGDHPLTARTIARELGIASEGRIMTGAELAAVSAEELEGLVEEVSIYARVSPEHKLRIVQALQNRNHIVAMTGDGVNDAPALKKADIGVAMGVTGTDVTKEVADMILLDDNFATIVAAVEEGRVIYDNIRKFIKYLLTSNSGEIWVMLLAPFWGMPLPLFPLQILWINLFTDGLPALALGLEPAERGVMRRPPYRPQENIFRRGLGRHILWVGLLMGLVPLLPGYWTWMEGNPGWQTMLFTILTFAQLSHALAIRSTSDSLFTIGLLSNKALLGAIFVTFVMQVAVVYVPWMQTLFRTVPLLPAEFGACILISTLIFWAVELEKWFIRRSIPTQTVV